VSGRRSLEPGVGTQEIGAGCWHEGGWSRESGVREVEMRVLSRDVATGHRT